MASVNLANIRKQSWSNIYNILTTNLATSDSVIKGVYDETNITFPVIIIPPVEVTSSLFSIDGSSWDGFVLVTIEIYTRSAADLDRVSDLVHYQILNNKHVLSSDNMLLLDIDSTGSIIIDQGKKKLYNRVLSFQFNVDI